MNSSFTFRTPLQSIFWPKDNSTIKSMLLILAGVFVLTVASQLSIPLEPVPLTFQSSTAVLIGMAFGARYGATVILTYLLVGAMGLPVFADFSGGLLKLFGTTGGYLAGFLPAAYLSGYLAEKGWAKSIFGSFFVACLGTCIIFSLGVSWLAMYIGWHNAIAFGFTPFVLSEAIKLVGVSILVPRIWKRK